METCHGINTQQGIKSYRKTMDFTRIGEKSTKIGLFYSKLEKTHFLVGFFWRIALTFVIKTGIIGI
jgi:hypothetical protein